MLVLLLGTSLVFYRTKINSRTLAIFSNHVSQMAPTAQDRATITLGIIPTALVLHRSNGSGIVHHPEGTEF